MTRRTGVAILVLVAACGGPSAPPPAPVSPAKPAAPAAADEGFAPIPYTAEQLRAAHPAGTELATRVELAGKPTTIQVIRFVAVDEGGAELEIFERDAQGKPAGTPVRSRSTWEELRRHAAFPRAATTIEDGVADTPAGTFPAKIYVVTKGDEVSTYYFAVDHPGPPVLFYKERAGARVLTATRLPNPAPASASAPASAPIACESVDDCWLDDQFQPIARPASERGKTPRPCADGSRLPACRQGACTVVAYKC